MSIIGTIRDKITSKLTSLYSQPLSKASLIIILFLDIFIIASNFDGLDKHTKQFSTPDDYIPYSCREIVINRDWNSTNRTNKLSHIILSYNNSYYQIGEKKKRNHHPVCAPFLDLLDQIKNDKDLYIFFEERNKLDREARDLNRQI